MAHLRFDGEQRFAFVDNFLGQKKEQTINSDYPGYLAFKRDLYRKGASIRLSNW